MEAFSWPSILFYCLFSAFLFYQQIHMKNFQGASQYFLLALNISVLAGTVTWFAYIIYYGWTISWWAPFVIFVIGLVFMQLVFLLERVVGVLALSISGFVGWPFSAILMFWLLPPST